MKDFVEREVDMPMVSIRCITYNHEPYIRQCLEGFVMQKTNFRFEAIVHDDASTDGTAAIIREYAEKYPDIIKPIFETENQYSKRDGSLGRIMNEACTGKYIAMCEGDDYWIDPLKLQKQVDFMETHEDYSMCWHDAYVLHNGKKYPYNRYKKDCDVSIEDLIIKGGDFCPTASLIYRKEMFCKYTSETKNYIFHVGDYPLQIYMGSVGNVRYMFEPMSVYRFCTNGSWSLKRTKMSLAQKRDFTYNKSLFLLDRMNQITLYKYDNLL